MLGRILSIAAIAMVVWTQTDAKCSKGCVCPSTASVVECNTIQLEPFGMHVFSLKIANLEGPVVVKNTTFNVQGLENVNTISIENATIIDIEEDAFSGIPLLSTLQIINCNISGFNNSSIFSKATSLRNLKITNSSLSVFEGVKSESIEELVLSGNKLEVITNDTFSDLTSLIYINLSDNFISKIDSMAFSKLLYLQDVFLNNNNITTIHPDLFKSNIELVTLDFSNNPLKKIDLNITDLEKLVLRSCQLEEINQNLTLNLDFLSYIDLSNNYINFTKTTFNKMTELDFIDLSHNNLKTLDTDIFRTNYKLQKIILDNNNFTVLPKFVCAGGSFETYYFSCNHCNISNLPIDTFKQFPALVNLNLANNNIISTNLSALHYLHTLIELDLSYNKITFLSSIAFSKSNALEKLNLAGNPLNTINPIIFENNRVLKSLDLSFCSLTQLWSQSSKNALGSLRQLILVNNSLSAITLKDLSVINSIEVLEVSNNPLQCDLILKDTITWLNEHEVSPVKFKTHEEINAVDNVVFEGTNAHWSWKELAKSKCSEQYYIEYFKTKHLDNKGNKKSTKAPEEYDYRSGDFDSDEDLATPESDDADQFGKSIVGMKISQIISSSQDKDNGHYSFLWPTLVFIFTSLSVLVIAANIMLLMLRTTTLPRNINIPHIKIPQWNATNKLKKHSGSVYQPLSEERYDSCISIGKKDPVPTHNNIQNNIP